MHLIDLTMGEDPLYFASGEFDGLVALVRAVKQATGLPVMISPGVVSAQVLEALRDAGAEWYACYQETHAPDRYAGLRMGQSFAERAAARSAAARLGMLVEDGMLLGVGETLDERALTVAAMRDEPVEQVRVMTFVPQRGTPLADLPPADRLGELVTIATMRLAMPERLIPASLDVDGIAGLEPRIAAGANVVTSLVPPSLGLAGVSQSELDIDEGLRTAAEVTHQAVRRHWGCTPRPPPSTRPGHGPRPQASPEDDVSDAGVSAMRLAVVGGKLQGTEAAYLAGEAGYEVVLIDRRPDRPAAGLAAEVHVFDVTTDPARAREVLLTCDAVLPACEDRARARVSDRVRAHDGPAAALRPRAPTR